uniref:F-box domain-containing protein n=1 Tax=Rhizophora mucronata TaxID=61149 RepID=A0A2P2QLQ1_RHIMU
MEKLRTSYGKHKKQVGLFDYLPEEIIIEILCKLPIKSIVRFSSACKSFYFLIKNPNFIATHLTKTLLAGPESDPLLLVRREVEGGEDRLAFHVDNHEFKEYMLLNLPFQSSTPWFHVAGTCNGLVCLWDDFDTIILWNPLIQKSLFVPKPRMVSQPHQVCFMALRPFRLCFGFGFDHFRNDYKVLRIVQNFGDHHLQGSIEVDIFSLNARSWKLLKPAILPGVRIIECYSLAFVNGSIHCLGFRTRNVVLGFDVVNKVFREIMLPDSLATASQNDLSLTPFKDTLIAVIKLARRHECWIMKEYGEVESWTKLLVIRPRFDLGEVLAFRLNGEVLYEGLSNAKIFAYNPVDKKITFLGARSSLYASFCSYYRKSLVLLDIGINANVNLKKG